MGAVPSEMPRGGETRIATGALTHFRENGGSTKLGAMVQEAKVHPSGGAGGCLLSPLQQGMLFHRLEAGSSGVDVEQCICELREPLDRGQFAQAWRLAVARHERDRAYQF